MPHISKVKLDRRVEKQLIGNLEVVLSRISKNEEMRVFLLSLLSSTERLMLAKRLAIVILLKEGLNDSQISNALGVTRYTVSRMELFLDSRGQGYNLALEKLNDEAALKEFKKFLIGIARYSVKAAGMGI